MQQIDFTVAGGNPFWPVLIGLIGIGVVIFILHAVRILDDPWTEAIFPTGMTIIVFGLFGILSYFFSLQEEETTALRATLTSEGVVAADTLIVQEDGYVIFESEDGTQGVFGYIEDHTFHYTHFER